MASKRTQAEQQSLDTQLSIAACAEDTKKIGRLLGQGANVDAIPLYIVALRGHVGVMTLLLNAGADYNATDMYGVTPLHNAAFNGNVGAVKLLLAIGADYSAKNQTGHTPLYEAASNDCIEVVKLLLNFGADPNEVGRITTSHYNCKKIQQLLQEEIDYRKTLMGSIHREAHVQAFCNFIGRHKAATAVVGTFGFLASAATAVYTTDKAKVIVGEKITKAVLDAIDFAAKTTGLSK